MRRLTFPLAALSLALAACSSETPVEEGDAPAAEAGDPVPEGAMPEATLDLQASGLIVPPQGGFEQLDVPFGSMRAATEATLANVLGEAKARGKTEECGYETTSYEGITLHFRDDKFVGYYANAPYVPELTRVQMLEDPAVKLVEDSTIDGEFTIGDPAGEVIGGVFVGEETRALWAGENCIAR